MDNFSFRNLHPQILVGTASDRYAGWIGQIYARDRYEGRITKRTKVMAGKSFVEEVLPVDSVAEYFEHFPILEIDSTFYRLLLDQNGQPTQNYQVLKTYARHLKEGDRIILKVPQLITAQKTHRGDRHNENPAYLNPKIFTDQFYDPAAKLLGASLAGFIFEQEYQRKEERVPVNAMAQSLDKFFSQISQRLPVPLRITNRPLSQRSDFCSFGKTRRRASSLPLDLAAAPEKAVGQSRRQVFQCREPIGDSAPDAFRDEV